MKIKPEDLKDINALNQIPERFLTAEQKKLREYASELQRLFVTIDDLGLTDVVTIEIKVSARGRKKQ